MTDHPLANTAENAAPITRESLDVLRAEITKRTPGQQYAEDMARIEGAKQGGVPIPVDLRSFEPTDTDRQMARDAIVKGFENCCLLNGRAGECVCDESRIDGCQAQVEAVARAIATARKI